MIKTVIEGILVTGAIFGGIGLIKKFLSWIVWLAI